jgi:hypothetical protein
VEHYVTLFDSAFLPQGLALHASLERNAGPFTLWVLCMDHRAKTILDSLNIGTIKTIALADIETPALLAVKPGRSVAEYCWTLTPFTPKLVFDQDSRVRRVTYVDADTFFLKSPQPIFDEFEGSGKSVLITDHGYAPEYDNSAAGGQYCVQFMTFVRDASEPVRSWWQDRCIEWCFNRAEDGKLGDQKYLDDWPTRFPTMVHVLKQLDLMLAPWNSMRFPYSRAIIWHFHGLRLLSRGRVLLHKGYAVPEVVDRFIYLPYIAQLQKALQLLGLPIRQAAYAPNPVAWMKTFVKRVFHLYREIGGRVVILRLPKK